ncbi:hypothetical protein ACEXQB_010115 [Herbiconiux sp. P18]|uniref:hypothetical protein n=1 Tax=Herbiconiux liangxiaofengii TaxID=3342795 RepID=UPI0035BA93E0
MGSNRRYADRIDAQMAKRVRERDLAPRPVSLTPDQIDLERDEPTEPPEPVPVRAWVPVSSGTIPQDAVVTAWNRRACRIEWKNGDGSRSTAWVWRGSVEPR